MIIQATILEFNKKNENGRSYDVESFDSSNLTGLVGQIGMPNESIIDVAKISHQIDSLQIIKSDKVPRKRKKFQKKHKLFKSRSKLLKAQIKLINNNDIESPSNTIKKLIDSSGGITNFYKRYAFRTAGIGELDENNVVKNFQLTSVNLINRSIDGDSFPHLK